MLETYRLVQSIQDKVLKIDEDHEVAFTTLVNYVQIRVYHSRLPKDLGKQEESATRQHVVELL
jgi:hypothetical protein